MVQESNRPSRSGSVVEASDAELVETDDPRADVEETATLMARKVIEGMRRHDRRDREGAVEAFLAVDRRQFAHADEAATREAAVAYVDALWAKDEVERAHTEEGEINGTVRPEALAAADWSPVESALQRRATAVGIDPAYAELVTEAWREHKTGGDYWSPYMDAQRLELRAAIGDEQYPHKPRHGRHGPGPEPVRYVLAVELHDIFNPTGRTEETIHSTERVARETVAAMRPYYERILRGQRTG